VDSPINDRLLSLKLTEQQIRNNHNVKSAKALGLVIEREREIGEPAIISAVVSVVVAIAILTLRSR
jgi:hypothetical protein